MIINIYIVLVIIILIIFFQLKIFRGSIRKIKSYNDVFPNDGSSYQFENEKITNLISNAEEDELIDRLKLIGLDSDDYYYIRSNRDGQEITVFQKQKAKNTLIRRLKSDSNDILVSHSNPTLDIILGSINDYLKNNKSVSDYHLMKDIVDRNCDALEDEIHTQIPTPLYLGLVGTMAGILVGILFLWLTGGINVLLDTSSKIYDNINGFETTKSVGVVGVETLLGSVALAMVASIVGILLTTFGSFKFKSAKSCVEQGKQTFLSWIQSRLLPTLSDNVVGAIREMTGNLENFNKEFATNTGDLGEALAKVNESYKLQKELIDAVNRIQEGGITSTNLALFNKLIESSEQIGKLATFLDNSNKYLDNVRLLNDKLDEHEIRTNSIIDVAVYFKTELSEIEARKSAISGAVGKVDDYLQQAFEKLKEHAENSFNELQKSSVKQHQILNDRAEEINKIINELQNLPEIKKSFASFNSTVKGQNEKLDQLARNIEKLAKLKTPQSNELKKDSLSLRIIQTSLIGIVAAACSILAVKSFIPNKIEAQNVEEYSIIELPTTYNILTPIILDTLISTDTINNTINDSLILIQ